MNDVFSLSMFFVPGLISTVFYLSISKKLESTSIFNFVVLVLIFSYFILTINIGILYLRGWGNQIFESFSINNSIQFIVKNLITSLVISLILPLMFLFVSRFLRITKLFGK